VAKNLQDIFLFFGNLWDSLKSVESKFVFSRSIHTYDRSLGCQIWVLKGLRWEKVYILWPFGIFYGHLIHLCSFWYIFPIFCIMYQEKSGNPDRKRVLGIFSLLSVTWTRALKCFCDAAEKIRFYATLKHSTDNYFLKPKVKLLYYYYISLWSWLMKLLKLMSSGVTDS
jgi:hypothetical protein